VVDRLKHRWSLSTNDHLSRPRAMVMINIERKKERKKGRNLYFYSKPAS
jgi:hypothetical protein